MISPTTCNECNTIGTTFPYDGQQFCSGCFHAIALEPHYALRAELLSQLSKNEDEIYRLGAILTTMPPRPASRELFQFCSCGKKYCSNLALMAHMAEMGNGDDHRAMASRQFVNENVAVFNRTTRSNKPTAPPKDPNKHASF